MELSKDVTADSGSLKMLGPRNGTIRRCGLAGVGVALLEWVWPCWRKCGLVGGGVALLVGGVSMVQARSGGFLSSC